MSVMTKLKPCPFCGGKAKIEKHESGMFFKSTYWFVICGMCRGRTFLQDTQEEAIEAWNKRTKKSEVE